MLDGMSIEYERYDTGAVIRVSGEVDIYNSPRFESVITAVQSQTRRTVLVDLRECRYMDSSAIRVIVDKSASLGSRFCVALLRGSSIARVFTILGLEGCLQVLATDGGGTGGGRLAQRAM
jgi:anti-anti-sigma factor